MISMPENEVIEEPQESISTFQYMGEQLRFWQDAEMKISLLKTEIERLGEEINSILNYIEDTTFNAAQGYKVYKVLRDKQMERKTLLKEVICLESIISNVDAMKLVQGFQDSMRLSDEKIKEANKITYIKELMGEEPEI